MLHYKYLRSLSAQGSPTKTPTAWQAQTSLESKVRRTSVSTLRCYHYAEEYERALLSRVVDEVMTILNFPDIAIVENSW